MIVIKRDGQEVNYNRSKIIVAIGKANEEVPEEERISDQEIEEIVSYVETRKRKRILVEDIQDIIEQKLMALGKFDWRSDILCIVIHVSWCAAPIQQMIRF